MVEEAFFLSPCYVYGLTAFYAFLSQRCLLRFAFWADNREPLVTVLAVVSKEGGFSAMWAVYLK